MKKILTLGILGLILVLALVQAASAYSYYTYSHYQPRFRYNYDSYSGYGYVCLSIDKYDCYSGRSGYPYRNSGDEITKRQAIRFVDKSFNKRYYVTAGMSSSQAFGGTDQKAQSKTNFRYKTVYNPKTDYQVNEGNDYYYKPIYDDKLGYFNWRY